MEVLTYNEQTNILSLQQSDTWDEPVENVIVVNDPSLEDTNYQASKWTPAFPPPLPIPLVSLPDNYITYGPGKWHVDARKCELLKEFKVLIQAYVDVLISNALPDQPITFHKHLKPILRDCIVPKRFSSWPRNSYWLIPITNDGGIVERVLVWTVDNFTEPSYPLRHFSPVGKYSEVFQRFRTERIYLLRHEFRSKKMLYTYPGGRYRSLLHQ
jgi:hypothetical protein